MRNMERRERDSAENWHGQNRVRESAQKWMREECATPNADSAGVECHPKHSV